MKSNPKKKRIVKEVVFMIGQGENCQCSDCPVLYGGDCPFDDEETNKKPRIITKKFSVPSLPKKKK